jgi:hypothetical protein
VNWTGRFRQDCQGYGNQPSGKVSISAAPSPVLEHELFVGQVSDCGFQIIKYRDLHGRDAAEGVTEEQFTWKPSALGLFVGDQSVYDENFSHVLVLTPYLSVFAQSPVDIRVKGERQMVRYHTADTAKQAALVDATRQAPQRGCLASRKCRK